MTQPATNWTFLHCNDSHMGTPRSYRFRPAVNERWAAIKQQMSQIDADLLLHGGDFTRDGDTHEFEYRQAWEDLQDLPFPTFAIPGNMDVGNKHARQQGARDNRDDVALNMTTNRLNLFCSYFGPWQWTFLHRNVRFTGFYAAVAGSGLPEEERFWRFIERLADLPRGQHHVAIMHYWLYWNHLDEPTWDMTRKDQYLPWYFTIDQPHRRRLIDSLKAAGVDLLFSGHVHTGLPEDDCEGIRYVRTPAAGNTAQMAGQFDAPETRVGFYRCDVTPDGIDINFVPGSDQVEEHDNFGPHGHPRPADRDYSIATEQPALEPD